MRGQGYDAASNMRGQFNGLQALFQKELNFVDSSAKRHSALRVIAQANIADLVAAGTLETSRGANQTTTLQRAGLLVGVHIFALFQITDFLCQSLQKKAIDILNALSFLDIAKEKLQALRDNGWGDLIVRVESFVVNMLRELDSRFTDQSLELLVLSGTLDLRDNFQAFNPENVHNLASKFYPIDILACDMVALDMECGYFLADVQRDDRFVHIASLSDLCRRNKMEDDFLDDLMVLYIEKELADSIESDYVI
ncbi:PREDICTED: uncharacterized protein LOC101313390 [Fragaria vesca subsp. vesca]